MAVDEFGKVGWGLVVEGFVCSYEDFEIDPVFDWEPVEVTEDGCDVVPGSGSGKQASGRVLNILQFFENFGGEAVEEAIAVVESGSYK